MNLLSGAQCRQIPHHELFTVLIICLAALLEGNIVNVFNSLSTALSFTLCVSTEECLLFP